MRFWSRTPSRPLQESVFVERRKPVYSCAACYRASLRFVYLDSGNHYCAACAREAAPALGADIVARRQCDLLEAG